MSALSMRELCSAAQIPPGIPTMDKETLRVHAASRSAARQQLTDRLSPDMVSKVMDALEVAREFVLEQARKHEKPAYETEYHKINDVLALLNGETK